MKPVASALPVRTILLCYLTTILGGVWLLEQPSGSVLEYHPTFRQMLLDHYLAMEAASAGFLFHLPLCVEVL